MKGAVFPEYVCAMHAARALGTPGEMDRHAARKSFLSDHHGRAQDFDAELALDKDGRILALRLTGYGDLGAYLTNFGPLLSTFNVVKHVASLYRTPLMEVSTRCVFTNTVPVTAYRGAGRPRGQLLHRAADRHRRARDGHRSRRDAPPQPRQARRDAVQGRVRLGLRLRRLSSDPRQGAGRLPTGTVFPRAQKASAARGKLRGRGIGQFLEQTAPVQKELGSIRFEADGTVTLLTGTHDHGQGHAHLVRAGRRRSGSAFPSSAIRVMQTDSDQLQAGGGTGGSKSIMASGTALVGASDARDREGEAGRRRSCWRRAPATSRFAGRAAVDRRHRSRHLADRPRRSKIAADPTLPADCPRSLDVDYVHEAAPATYPNGCHIAEVEIDPDTGIIAGRALHDGRRLRHAGEPDDRRGPVARRRRAGARPVPDGGRALRRGRPAAVRLVHGLRHAARRRHAGRCATPIYRVPTKSNPLGVKGCGEAGASGGLPSIMNAIVDALSPVRHQAHRDAGDARRRCGGRSKGA